MSLNRVVVSSLVAGVLSLGLLAGCGKRGPLYLPPPPEQPAPAAEQATEQEEDKSAESESVK